MIVVYVAGRFRGANPWEVHQHVCEAERWAFEVAQLGAMPLCPHANTAHFDGTLTDEFWLEGTLELLRRCDAVFLTPNWTRSRGSQAEAKLALERRIPIFLSRAFLGEWIRAHEHGNHAEALGITDLAEHDVRAALAELEGEP